MAKLLILHLILMTSFAYSTVFVPVPIKKQLRESTGVVQGEVINFESLEEDNGKIITKVFLRADKWIGLEADHGFLEVYLPGGQIGDQILKVEGAPKFEIGEKVVLLLKNYKGKNWVQNLALGKYMVRKYGSTEIMINSVFPEHPEVGQMTLNSFYDLVYNVKSAKLNERFRDKYEIQAERSSFELKNERQARDIASIKTEEEKETDNKASTLWVLFFFGLLGLMLRFVRKKQSE